MVGGIALRLLAMAYGRAAIVTYSMQIGLVATALTIALLCLSVCRRTALFGLATALALFVLMQGTLGDNVRGHMILDRRIARQTTLEVDPALRFLSHTASIKSPLPGWARPTTTFSSAFFDLGPLQLR